MQTRPDGTVEHVERRTLDVFDSFYVDDIPVTKEQIKPLLVKGARISTFENRSSWYFLRVVTRNHASQVGFLTGLSGNALTLSRPQMSASKAIFTKPDKPSSGTDADGIVNLHYGYYRWLPTTIKLDEDALVRYQGQLIPWKQTQLSKWVKTPDYPDVSDLRRKVYQGNKDLAINGELQKRMSEMLTGHRAVLVQAARPQTRVEILPPRFGDWPKLVNERETRYLGGPCQLKGQFLGIMLPGNPVTKELDVRDYLKLTEEPQLKTTQAFRSYLLAGGPELPGPIWRGLYYKGEHWMVDGYFVNRDGLNWKPIYTPGLFFVAHIRRARSTPDLIATDSESVAAWGTITQVKGNTLTLKAPAIDEVPISGDQSVTLPANAAYYHLGRQLTAEQVRQMLVVGALVRVYPARPQTILINED
jgi:hypothetical protein